MTVSVPARLTHPHPLVVATQAAATKAKPDETGRLLLGGEGVARLRVSRSAVPRALRILDPLCKEAQTLGWNTNTGRRYSGVPCTRFVKDEWDVEFKIVESTNKTAHVRTAAEEKDAQRGRAYGIPDWDYEPNGRLSLVLDSYVAERTRFNDGVRQRLEDTWTK